MKRPQYSSVDSDNLFVPTAWSAEKKAAALATYRGAKTMGKRLKEAFLEKRGALREADEASNPASEANWLLKKAENLAQRKLLTRLVNELTTLEQMNGDKR